MNKMWLVAITTDTGCSEDGNLHYCDFRVYPTKEAAVAAVLSVSPNATVEEYPNSDAINITDEAGNWFLVQPVDDDVVVPQMDPEEYEEEDDIEDSLFDDGVMIQCTRPF